MEGYLNEMMHCRQHVRLTIAAAMTWRFGNVTRLICIKMLSIMDVVLRCILRVDEVVRKLGWRVVPRGHMEGKERAWARLSHAVASALFLNTNTPHPLQTWQSVPKFEVYIERGNTRSVKWPTIRCCGRVV